MTTTTRVQRILAERRRIRERADRWVQAMGGYLRELTPEAARTAAQAHCEAFPSDDPQRVLFLYEAAARLETRLIRERTEVRA